MTWFYFQLRWFKSWWLGCVGWSGCCLCSWYFQASPAELTRRLSPGARPIAALHSQLSANSNSPLFQLSLRLACVLCAVSRMTSKTFDKVALRWRNCFMAALVANAHASCSPLPIILSFLHMFLSQVYWLYWTKIYEILTFNKFNTNARLIVMFWTNFLLLGSLIK